MHINYKKIILVLNRTVLLLSACNSTSVPSDETLISNFRENKSDFEKLITMFNQDKKLEFISQNTIFPINSITEEGKEEYYHLLKKLKVTQIKAYDKNKNISINAYSRGISVTGSAKGYKYWGEPIPSHLEVVKNLDENYQKEREKGVPLAYYVFRHIEGNWYLYYSVDD